MQSKIDQKILDKWAAGLLSGEFKQIRYAMENRVNERCALGAAKEILDCDSFTHLQTIIPDEIRYAAIYANDYFQWDFAKIARWLQKGAQMNGKFPKGTGLPKTDDA